MSDIAHVAAATVGALIVLLAGMLFARDRESGAGWAAWVVGLALILFAVSA
jgi:hypothetical protein